MKPVIRVGADAAVADEPTTWLHPLEHKPPLRTKLQLLTYTGIAVYGTWSWEGGFIAWAPCLKIPKRFKNMMWVLPNWEELRNNTQTELGET